MASVEMVGWLTCSPSVTDTLEGSRKTAVTERIWVANDPEMVAALTAMACTSPAAVLFDGAVEMFSMFPVARLTAPGGAEGWVK